MSLKLRLNLKGKQFSKHTDDFHRPSPHNFIFQKELLFVGCPYSRAKGRKKNFRTLWKIWLHVKFEHGEEIEHFRPIIWNLAEYVMKGVLK